MIEKIDSKRIRHTFQQAPHLSTGINITQKFAEDNSRALIMKLIGFAVRCEEVRNRSCRSLNLARMRRQISDEKSIHKYAKIHSGVFVYRTAFFSLAAIFCALGVFAFTQNLMFTTNLFGSFGLLPKTIIGSISLLLAVAALWMGSSICLAKESAHYIAKKAHEALRKLCAFDETELRCRTTFLKWQSLRKQQTLAYQNIDRAILEKREEIVLVLKKIQKSKELSSKDKQTLFAETLHHMENDLLKIINLSLAHSTAASSSKVVMTAPAVLRA